MDIGLADAIAVLRGELAKAIDEGEGKDIRFVPEKIELDLQLVVGREGGGRAGIKFWIFELGGDAKATDQRTHRLNLSLLPVGRDGRLLVSSKDDEEFK